MGLLFLETEDSNHSILEEKRHFDDKVFANQLNITEELLNGMSSTSCGRLCTNLRNSLAFSYHKKNCYCYREKNVTHDRQFRYSYEKRSTKMISGTCNISSFSYMQHFLYPSSSEFLYEEGLMVMASFEKLKIENALKNYGLQYLHHV